MQYLVRTVNPYRVVTVSEESKTVKLVVFLPEDLRHRFKVETVKQGTNMSAKASELIEEWLAENEKN